VGSILDVRSTGLGRSAHEVKRHSRVKVHKVSHIVKKINRKLPKHKEIYIRKKKAKKPKKR
jgi:hypothetical protein